MKSLIYIHAVLFYILTVLVCSFTIASELTDDLDLTELSIEELMSIEITSVSKKKESLYDAPSAVYVITSDDIRRSGVTSIPEALRLAPGVEVAQLDANNWAISIRGFNERFATKLLVLIDGRSIYTPLFAGVHWEEVDTLLEDIDRIEVIRGPGGTLWGSNAVNGVINIITKHTKDTEGVYLKAGGGNEEQGFVSLRYGGKANENLSYRVWGKFFNKDDFASTLTSGQAYDERQFYKAGIRADWAPTVSDNISAIGNIYRTDFEGTITLSNVTPPLASIVETDSEYKGGNFLTKWGHTFTNKSKSIVQVYYDYNDRTIFFGNEKRHTFDTDIQYNFPRVHNNEIIAGAGLRIYSDDINTTTSNLTLTDNNRTDYIYSAFVQDKISLFSDKFNLILGSKFEHNDYSGFEIQPNFRFIVKPNDKHRIWGAVSRAVRIPNRIEEDLRLNLSSFQDPNTGQTTLIELTGNNSVDPEELIAFELGYRFKPSERVYLEFTGYLNYYDDLITFEPGQPFLRTTPVPHIVVPLFYDNKSDGKVYGFEVNTIINPIDIWTIKASYSFIHIDLEADSDSNDPTATIAEGRSPENQIKIQSELDLPYNFEFDTNFFYTDDLDLFNISDFFRVDARLGWKPTENIELSVVGQNLFDSEHQEFGQSFFIIPSRVQRSFYGSLSLRF